MSFLFFLVVLLTMLWFAGKMEKRGLERECGALKEDREWKGCCFDLILLV